MTHKVATIDFHVTSECSQSCPYCWGPQEFIAPVDTGKALRIVSRIKEVGARRIVFTGGDPLARPDINFLLEQGRDDGLEVALSTTGDLLTPDRLAAAAQYLDLVSLPLDGSNEEVNSRTKEADHFQAVMLALQILRDFPAIDVKICTPVTRRNIDDVRNIARLVEEYARTTAARVFYNIFQAFPRAMFAVDWQEILVSDEEFAGLKQTLAERKSISINLLDHATLDRLYVMVFPDGSLVIPRGREFFSYGQFLEIRDLDPVLDRSRFAWARHLEHSQGWSRRAVRGST
ncbi:MAG: radical SAM protein [Gemmatimonadota bacterium]|nr:MAG: radical SAM protein [Gemmatimonadota bacterium]